MKYLIGKVVSDRMHKSIMVAVERWMILPKYNFRMKRHSKIMAHDENNECHIGDLVRIETSRPISKRKAWKLTDIIVKENLYDPEAAAAASAQRLREREAAAQPPQAPAELNARGRRRLRRFGDQPRGFAAAGAPEAEQAAQAG